MSKKDTLVKDAALGNLLAGRLTGGAAGIALPAKPDADLTFFLPDKALCGSLDPRDVGCVAVSALITWPQIFAETRSRTCSSF